MITLTYPHNAHIKTPMPTTRSQLRERSSNQCTGPQLETPNRNDTRTRHNDAPERPELNPDQNPPDQAQKVPSKKGQRRRSNIKLGTLNINGLRSLTDNNSELQKWIEINATMKKERIAILAIQETHLDETYTQEILRAFGKRLVIHNSQLENNPRSSAGVAFVLNKELIKTDQVRTFELAKGRAIAIKLTWINNEEATLINVYAPVRRSDHESFWEKVRREWDTQVKGKPDFILGDFNLTEEPIDRSPARHDNAPATRSIRDFRLAMGVQDQWRHIYPKAREFTYRSITNGKPIKSRLDRIYINKECATYTFDWAIAPSSVPTDHWLVTLKYAPKDAPYIGKGRWTWPLRTLKDTNVIKRIAKEGMNLQRDLDNLRQDPGLRNDSVNPQTLWKNFKTEITRVMEKEERKPHFKCLTKIRNLKKDRKETLRQQDLDENTEAQWHEAILANEIEHLEKLISYNNRERVKAKIALHGEKLGGTWSNLSKSKRPRDTIQRLKVPDTIPLRHEVRSDRMADLARNHHESLQNINKPDWEDPSLTQELEEILEGIPISQKFPNAQRSTLNDGITTENVEEALKRAKNGTATGLDGCPYELWKELKKHNDTMLKAGKRGFDIVQTLTDVFQDIQLHGIEPETFFANGWMCPLYKKKDPAQIENYRPITLLNTDYKLLTRALSLQLLESIKQVVHRDQAGFIPGRSIFDHIRLSRLMTTFAEVTETNGAIVALDQEKAYDKIDHDYLWKTLEAFGLPKLFTQTVKSLYNDAHTVVAINGVLSKPFRVSRGVRQGDPLSCFLFDIGIEPLACQIRYDANISGYNIPGLNEKLAVNLFADDTVLYLSARDSYDGTVRTLDKWCRVSGAQFNKEKTEIIPIGTKAHRKKVIRTRKLNPNDQRIPDDVHIAQDGEAIRSLGAWIGNNTQEEYPWETIIDAVHRDLERWKSVHPTLDGKRLIVQAIVGGRTQFLAKAQGMPKRIREVLTKEIRNFIWGDECHIPRVGLDHLENTKEQGGIKLLNLKARDEAIEIVWLRDYLNLTKTRPSWAFITDILLNETTPLTLDQKTRQNAFLQTWDIPTTGKRADKLGKDTVRMIKAAKKYKATFAPINISRTLRENLPAWNHLGMEKTIPRNTQAKCLAKNHNSTRVKDLLRITERLQGVYDRGNHQPDYTCKCEDCDVDSNNGCKNPQRCALEAQKRIQRITPKLHPLRSPNRDNLTKSRPSRNYIAERETRENAGSDDEENPGIIFNPSVTVKSNLSDCFRIFVNPSKVMNIPAKRQPPPRGIVIPDEEITVYTDGSCLNNGKVNAQCGSGIWFEEGSEHNRAIRVPGPDQSNQIGELAAIIIALEIVPNFIPLTIKTDSRYAMDGLTTHLPSWENQGWINIANKQWFQRAAYLLRKRTAKTRFKWVKGHNGDLGNEMSDLLANQGANKDTPDVINLEVPPHFDQQGAKLATITQAIAYKGIQERNEKKQRRTTALNLEKVRNDIELCVGTQEPNEAIWKHIRKTPIRPKIQQFFYKTLHDAYKIGRFWLNIQTLEDRCFCPTCRSDETMDHILTLCEHPARSIIWREAKRLWPHGENTWPRIALGTIIGCNTLSVETLQKKKDESGQTQLTKQLDPGATRLLKIIVSESAYLIWTLRCERAIRGKERTDKEIEVTWLKVINRRLSEDKTMATKILRREQYTNIVRNTWDRALYMRHRDLPDDWINRNVVF